MARSTGSPTSKLPLKKAIGVNQMAPLEDAVPGEKPAQAAVYRVDGEQHQEVAAVVASPRVPPSRANDDSAVAQPGELAAAAKPRLHPIEPTRGGRRAGLKASIQHSPGCRWDSA
jgi:hypothetical protein